MNTLEKDHALHPHLDGDVLHITLDENDELQKTGKAKVQINNRSYLVIDKKGKILENETAIYRNCKKLQLVVMKRVKRM